MSNNGLDRNQAYRTAVSFRLEATSCNSTTVIPRPIPFPPRSEYVPGMANGKSIERWQARKINDALYPGINYLARLQERMIRVGFTLDDPLYVLVTKAYDAMLHLSGELHYRSCEGGAGR